MKYSLLIPLTLLATISSANVISVYEVFDGKEKLIAQKDVSSEWEGYLYYNPCQFNPDIKSVDYPKCESYIHYRNFVNGETTFKYKHNEFKKSENSLHPDVYILDNESVDAATTGFGNVIDKSTFRINVTSTPMLIKDETYEALKRMQSHQK